MESDQSSNLESQPSGGRFFQFAIFNFILSYCLFAIFSLVPCLFRSLIHGGLFFIIFFPPTLIIESLILISFALYVVKFLSRIIRKMANNTDKLLFGIFILSWIGFLMLFVWLTQEVSCPFKPG